MSHSEAPLSPLLTREEAAQKLNLSLVTIDRLRRQGELDAVKLGRAVRIPVASVEAFLAKQGVFSPEKEFNEFLRHDVRRLVNNCCFQRQTLHSHVWRTLYEWLEQQTGFVVPDGVPNKLDEVERAGHLEALHRLAGQLR